jgi:hypothetical protein
MEQGETQKLDLPKIFGEGILSPSNIIRCVAPGFVALYVLMFVDRGFNPFRNETTGYPDWVIFTGIVLSGIFIQAIHATVLIRLIWLPAMAFHRYIKKNPLIDTLYEKLGVNLREKSKWSIIIMWDIMSQIDNQRWRRRASENREIRRFQQQLDNWGAFQNLLYCSIYITLIIPLYIRITRAEYIRPNWLHILCAGVFLLIFAVISEYRATNAELKASNEYFDGHKKKQKQGKKG